MAQEKVIQETADALVRALHRARVKDARAHFKKLRHLIPEHPALVHIARQIAVIDFRWPLPRAYKALAPRPVPAPDQLDLVAFHADMRVAPSGLHGPIDYLEVLALSFESAAIRAPQARRILLTDEHTQVPTSVPASEVIRYPVDLTRLMYERMRVQALYLASRPAGRFSVLMDTDVVVNREPSVIFASPFDVGLTWRTEFAEAPFNGGMIFVSEGAQGLAFFRQTLDCYDALAADPAVAGEFDRDLRAWWGDQFALAVTVGYEIYAKRRGDCIEVADVAVGLFPCEDYNFTLEPNTDYARETLAAKYFVHFKGNRKALQAKYLALMRGQDI